MADYTLIIEPTPHGRPTPYGPYAKASSAVADLLDWVYGLNAHAGWVESSDGRIVASVGAAQTKHAGAIPCGACDGNGWYPDYEDYGVGRLQWFERPCEHCDGSGIVEDKAA